MDNQFDSFDSINPGDIVSFYNQALDILIGAGDADAALLYLCLARNGNSEALPWDFDRVEAARKSLIYMDLIPDDPDQNSNCQTRPEKIIEQNEQKIMIPSRRAYTINDVAIALDHNEDFRNLVPAVEQRLERILSKDDLISLYAAYDSTGLTSDNILKITDYCILQSRKGGQYRTATVTQICRKAKELAQGSIHLPPDIDAPPPETPPTGREVEILRLLFNGKIRRPVEQESLYLKAWIDAEFSDDLLEMAYERTIFQLQKFNWAYMNGILRNWHNAGLTTPEEVERYEEQQRKSFQPAPSRPPMGPSPDTGVNPVTAEAIEQMFNV